MAAASLDVPPGKGFSSVRLKVCALAGKAKPKSTQLAATHIARRSAFAAYRPLRSISLSMIVFAFGKPQPPPAWLLKSPVVNLSQGAFFGQRMVMAQKRRCDLRVNEYTAEIAKLERERPRAA